MAGLSIRLLGPFQVESADNLAADFASDKARALLAYLVTEADQPHRRDKLAGLLWPDSPQRAARTNLRRSLADLRKAVNDHQASPPYLLITRQTIQFNSASDVWLDIADFTSLQEAGSSEQLADQRAIRRLEETIALYRGHFLEGFFLNDSLPFDEWALLNRESFQRQALALLHRLIGHYEAVGRYEHAVPHARQQVELDPLQEPAQRQLMRLLALTDQRAAALSQYETLRRLLHEELGVTPSSRTRELYERILAGDLDLAANAESGVRGYVLQEPIGSGRHGSIYRAVQPGVDREVAVKVIGPDYANRPDFIRRFEADTQLVARLEHPHIVPLYDYWREPDGAYLVMRWLRGGSLRDTLTDGPLSPTAIVPLIDQIAAALDAAHRQGIVHRGIKLTNMLLDEGGNVYLSDFGIAREEPAGGYPADLEVMTCSPDHISPEQVLDEPITPRTDLYNLGLVLYEMLTGQHPFAGLSEAEMVQRCLQEPIPSVRATCSDTPAAVDGVVQQATARQPAGRFPDALALAAAFRKAVSTDGVGEMAPAPTATGIVLSNPYKGLRPFQDADASVFYGRAGFVQHLISRFTPEPTEPGGASLFLAVVGPSGSGKSSIVKAGLIPALRQGAVPGAERCLITEMTPGAHPLQELENALLPIAVTLPPDLQDLLREDDQGLLRALGHVLPIGSDGKPSSLLLFIDQFEELFTLVEDDGARHRFLDSLMAAVNDPRGLLRVVITLRADFYDRPLEYPLLAELMQQHTELVLPLSLAKMEEAISKPAAGAGIMVEPQLVAAILADAQAQPGALPLLQYALTELFERRQGSEMTLAAYQEIGGVVGAISRRAEALYADMDADGKGATRQLFLRLVTLGGGASADGGLPDTRRRALQSELSALGSADNSEKAAILKAIEAYGRYRLLTFDRDPITRAATVEVAHESLLRQWPRLRGWLDESRADVRQQRLLASAAGEWLAADRNDSFLLRGGRLEQFSGWARNSTVALTHQEQGFLSASQAARQQRQAAEETRRRRELETARQLAETERERAEEQAKANRRLRQRAFLLAAALIVAAILAVLASGASRRASENALAAQSNAELASTREAEALTEAGHRATAEVIAVQEREEAEAQERQARARALAGASVNNLAVDPELSVLLALQAVDTTYAVDGNWTPEAVDALHQAIRAASRLQRVLRNPAGAMNWITYSPDGKLLGASTFLADQDVMTTVWDAATGQELFNLPTSISAFSEDGSQLITWRADGLNLIWEIWDTASIEITEAISLYIDDLGYSAGGALSGDWNYFALRYWDNIVNVWRMASNEKILSLREHVGMVNTVEYSHDGHYLATGGSDGAVKIWRVPAGSASADLDAVSVLTMEHADSIDALAFSSDDHYLATVSHDFTAVIWDLAASLTEGSPVASYTFPLSSHAESITQVSFNADGSLLVVISQDGLVKVWDTTTGEERLTTVSNEITRSTAFRPDGTGLVTANDGGLVQFWDVTAAGDKEWFTLTGHDGTVNQVTFSPDSKQLATASSDETVKIWGADSGKLLTTLSAHSGDVRAVTYCPDGSCLATASNDGTVKLWDLASERELSTFYAYEGLPLNPIPENNALEVAFTPDGRRLVTVGMDNEPEVWDTATGAQLMLLEGHWYNVVSAAVSNDGRLIATTGPDGMMIIWDSSTGEQLIVQETTQYGSKDAVFSPNDDLLASADNDGLVRVWDMDGQEGERLLLTLPGHKSAVSAVAFSPDGHTIASASANQIRVWDTETGQPLYTLPGHTRVVLDIEFSPDGSRLASASADGTVRLFVLPIEELVELARSRLTRSLTDAECQLYLHAASCPAGPLSVDR